MRERDKEKVEEVLRLAAREAREGFRRVVLIKFILDQSGTILQQFEIPGNHSYFLKRPPPRDHHHPRESLSEWVRRNFLPITRKAGWKLIQGPGDSGDLVYAFVP